jgi:hypothetical protein
VLKEPLVLSHLAGRKRALDTADSAKWAALSKKVSGLLDRSFAEEAVIVKPSNFANAVITDLLDGNPRRKFILMSCSLRGLLLSILKKQVEAANSMESFLAALLQDSDYLTRVQIRSPDSLSLLQQSVVFWHCQRHQFQVIRSRFAADRCLTTTMEEFLAQPLQTLESINSFLGLDLPPGLLRQTVESGAFTLHSKQQEASYSPEQQKREAQAIAVRYKNELDRAVAWAQPLFDAVPVEALTEFEEPLNGFL